MQSDADRFRPRERGGTAEHSPPTPGASGSAGGWSSAQDSASSFGAQYEAQPQQAQPSHGQQPQAHPQHAQPQRYSPPPGMQPPQGAPHAAPSPGAAHAQPPHSAPHAAPPAMYAMPRSVPPHFATSFDGRDAPLIHPAAAQASNVTPYGVPVYQTPAYASASQPQRGLSITALVLGLCSMLFAWTLVVVPIIGIVFGFIALRREPAGRVMSIIGLVGSGIGLLLVLLIYLLPLLAVLTALVLTATGP